MMAGHLRFGFIMSLIFFVLQLFPVNSKIIEGVLETSKNWAFLSKFCFAKKGGRYEYKFEYPSTYNVQSLLAYHDANEKWKTAYTTNLTCHEKEADLNPSQIVNLTKSRFDRNNHGCRKIMKYFLNTNSSISIISSIILCNASWTFTGARDRWWYMAISNCQSKKGLYLKYKIIMKNGNDQWFGHFSADEFYVIHILLIFCILYIILFFLSLLAAYTLQKKNVLHPSFKLFMSSVLSQVIGLAFWFVAQIVYSEDGQGLPQLQTTGQIFLAMSSVIFIYLILLLGEGYSITSTKMSCRLSIFIYLYYACYATLFFYEIIMFDPAEVLYLYESPGGYGLITMRIISAVLLLYTGGYTLKKHPHNPIYVSFLIFYFYWFVINPILILILIFVINNWIRKTYSVGLDLSVSFLGHVFFLIFAWPKFSFLRLNENTTNLIMDNDGTNPLNMNQEYPQEFDPRSSRRLSVNVPFQTAHCLLYPMAETIST